MSKKKDKKKEVESRKKAKHHHDVDSKDICFDGDKDNIELENVETLDVTDGMDENKEPPRQPQTRGARTRAKKAKETFVDVDAPGNDVRQHDINPFSRCAKQLVTAAEHRWKSNRDVDEQWRDAVTKDITDLEAKLHQLTQRFDTYANKIDDMGDTIVDRIAKRSGNNALLGRFRSLLFHHPLLLTGWGSYAARRGTSSWFQATRPLIKEFLDSWEDYEYPGAGPLRAVALGVNFL